MESTGSLPQGTDQIDIGSVAFAKRLANLLLSTRHERRVSVWSMSRRSNGRFSRRDLRAWEAGERCLDAPTVLQLTGLYGCDVTAILPARLPVSVEFGRITAGGVSAPFEPLSSTSLLEAYLRLVRSLRRQKNAPTVELRRDDIEVLAAYLQEAGEIIVERLGALMGATRSQRTAMAGLFATGAVVIGLVGTAAASAPSAQSGIPHATGAVPAAAAPSDSDVSSHRGTAVPLILVASDRDFVGVAMPSDSVTSTGAASESPSTNPTDTTGGGAGATATGTSEVPFVDTDLFDQADSSQGTAEVGLPPLP